MKILPLGDEMTHADGRTDRPEESNSRLSHFANAPKMISSASSTNQQVFVLHTSCVLCQVRKEAQLCDSCTCHSPNLRELRCDNLNYSIC